MSSPNCITDSDPANSTDDNTLDQNKVHALAAMVISQLPYPPMPLCVLKGEDNADGVCSSHDLLARAIAVQYVNSVRSTGSGMPSEEVTERKTTILTSLLMDLFELSKVISCDDVMAHVERIYELFQKSFRSYLALYPATSQDVRFAPIDSVDTPSLIMQQATSHLNAMQIQAQESQPSAQCKPPSVNSYRDAIVAYFLELTQVLENTKEQVS